MRDRPNALMLFAAGLGTRMGALVTSVPKPLLMVDGKPLIDHALDVVAGAGVQSIVVNTHYKSELIEEHLNERNIGISREYPTLLETGGGLKKAVTALGPGPVFTLNSDAVWKGGNPLRQLADAWNPDTMDGLLLLVPPAGTFGHVGKGDFEFAENKNQIKRGPGLIYTGAQITTTTELDTIRETSFSLNKIWDIMESRQRLYGVVYDGHWCDVGHPEGIAAAENMLSADLNV